MEHQGLKFLLDARGIVGPQFDKINEIKKG